MINGFKKLTSTYFLNRDLMQFFIVFSFECWDALLINIKRGFIFSNSRALTSVSITNF